MTYAISLVNTADKHLFADKRNSMYYTREDRTNYTSRVSEINIIAYQINLIGDEALRRIILNENDFYGSCTGECDTIGEVFNLKGCSKISGCRMNSAGWTRGFTRCDFCACNCEEDMATQDKAILVRSMVSVEEEDLTGTCTGTCERPGLVRSDFMGCDEVRDCYEASGGPLSGFVNCDHCSCTCVSRRYAASYELTNMHFDFRGTLVNNGRPTALSKTILVVSIL